MNESIKHNWEAIGKKDGLNVCYSIIKVTKYRAAVVKQFHFDLWINVCVGSYSQGTAVNFSWLTCFIYERQTG
jgi:hypothetical protein